MGGSGNLWGVSGFLSLPSPVDRSGEGMFLKDLTLKIYSEFRKAQFNFSSLFYKNISTCFTLTILVELKPFGCTPDYEKVELGLEVVPNWSIFVEPPALDVN